jgi:hypothetical protein
MIHFKEWVSIRRLESEKEAKNSYGSYPTEFVFEVKNEISPQLDQFF